MHFLILFGKIGRAASEKVILSLSSAKCIRCLLHAFEELPFNSSPLKSLGFLLCILLKMFKTGYCDIVSQCQEFCNFPDVSELILGRKRKFNNKLTITDNLLCNSVKFKFEIVD